MDVEPEPCLYDGFLASHHQVSDINESGQEALFQNVLDRQILIQVVMRAD